MSESNGTREIDPLAMRPSEVAMALSKSGSIKVAASDVDSDIDAGAPTNPDGTINLIRYIAWLVDEVSIAGGRKRDP